MFRNITPSSFYHQVSFLCRCQKSHQANKICHFLIQQSLVFSDLSGIWDFDKRFKLEVRGQCFPKSQTFSFVLASRCHSCKNVWKFSKLKYMTAISGLAELLQASPHPVIVMFLSNPPGPCLRTSFSWVTVCGAKSVTLMFLVCLLGLALTLAGQCQAREVFVSET